MKQSRLGISKPSHSPYGASFGFVLLLAPALPAGAVGPWTADPAPIITGDFPKGYGDPTVIKLDTTYHMFLTAGFTTPANPHGVQVYSATSTDGVSWTVDPQPRLTPAKAAEKWDGQKVETPSLVRFGGKWHMYYCGFGANGRYQIGHATSTSLRDWKKSSANPVVKTRSITDGSRVLHVCEPSAVVFNNRLYLYFVVAKARPAPASFPPGQHAIYLAISKNSKGDRFTPPVQVLAQGPRYPAAAGYSGYSTVDVHADGDTLHMFHDVYWYNGHPRDPWEGYYQVALEHATSTDGKTWTEDAAPILTRNQFAWTSREIRSPAALRDDTNWKLWFAGDDVSAATFAGTLSIGYATAPP